MEATNSAMEILVEAVDGSSHLLDGLRKKQSKRLLSILTALG